MTSFDLGPMFAVLMANSLPIPSYGMTKPLPPPGCAVVVCVRVDALGKP